MIVENIKTERLQDPDIEPIEMPGEEEPFYDTGRLINI